MSNKHTLSVPAHMLQQCLLAGSPCWLAPGGLVIWQAVHRALDRIEPAPLLHVLLLLQVTDQLPEAFSLLGFAFYLQPLIMPIIREMPEGKAGRQALTAAVHTSLMGECSAVVPRHFAGRLSCAQLP